MYVVCLPITSLDSLQGNWQQPDQSMGNDVSCGWCEILLVINEKIVAIGSQMQNL